MNASRVAAVIVTIALVVLSAAAVFVLDPLGREAPSATPGTPRPTATTSASAAAEAPSALEIVAAAEGPPFTLDTQRAPTADVGQSKLWFHAGAWWAAMVPDGTTELRIHRLDWATQTWADTGVRIGPRASVYPDVVVDGEHLLIATGGSASTGRVASLLRYTYLGEAGRYASDPDMPVTIAAEEAEGLTIARDGGGRTWATWITEGQLRLNRTDGSDWVWGTPRVPAIEGTEADVDAAVIVSYGETVAIAWTRTDADALNVAIARPDDPDAWDVRQVAISGLMPEDDELNVTVLPTADGPRLFAAVRTSVAELPDASPGSPQLLLVVLEPDGSSRQSLVGTVGDRQGRARVLVDADGPAVYVVATSPSSGGAIVYKSASLDQLTFGTGPGAPLLNFAALPALDDATSTKQVLGAGTGIVVLASDPVAGSYAHAAARFPGTAGPSSAVAPIVPPATDRLVDDRFDPFPPGAALGSEWTRRSDGSATFTIEDVDSRRAATAFGVSDGSTVRMCRGILPVGDGQLRIESELSISRVGPDNATVTSVRHGSGESAVVRLSDRGTFSYFVGAEHVRSEVPYVPGTWYTSVVTVDFATQTYAWEVRRTADGSVAFRVADVPWRTPDAGAASDVCFESNGGTTAQSIFAVDRLVVDH